jgi:hypothetical protein
MIFLIDNLSAYLLLANSEHLTQAFAALTRFQGVLTKPTKLATCTVLKIIAARQRPQHAGLESLFSTIARM